MDGLREGHRHATVNTHGTRSFTNKFYKPLVCPPRPCITDSAASQLLRLLAMLTQAPSGRILSEHGLNLWKHAVEVSIDYCTSCMNG